MNKYFLLISSLVLLFFFVLKLIIPDFFIFTKNPRLIKGLSSEISVAEKQFNTRVKEKFFSKTYNTQISNELSRQGFIIKINKKGRMIALYEEHNIACHFIWSISWEVDSNEYIYDLKARYRTTCL